MKKAKQAHNKTSQKKSPRNIGVVGAFSIDIGGIVGGGIFATLGLAGSQARGATFLSFIVGGVVALLTAYSYVRLSLTYPGEGGTVTFLNRAFGNGRFAGGLNMLLVLSYVIIMALYAGAFANYAKSFCRRGRAAPDSGCWRRGLSYCSRSSTWLGHRWSRSPRRSSTSASSA